MVASEVTKNSNSDGFVYAPKITKIPADCLASFDIELDLGNICASGLY